MALFRSETPLRFKSLLRLFMYLRSAPLRRKESKRLISIEKAIETIRIEYERAEFSDLEEQTRVYSLSLFILTIEYDISSLSYMWLSQINGWDKTFLSRQMAVLMYEATNDLLELLGKDFRNLINSVPDSIELTHELNIISKELNSFKKNNKEFLQKVRNYCGAHRDKNGFEQFKMIRTMSEFDVMSLLQTFSKPVSRMTPLLTNVFSSMIKKVQNGK